MRPAPADRSHRTDVIDHVSSASSIGTRVAVNHDEHSEAALPPERLPVPIDNLHRAGELARSRGFDAALHFQAGSHVETFDEIRRVMVLLDPGLAGMCLDTGHARFGGAHPTLLLRDDRPMVRHVHIKDCDLGALQEVRQSGGGLTDAWSRGVFCELGTGTGDVGGFLAALRAPRGTEPSGPRAAPESTRPRSGDRGLVRVRGRVRGPWMPPAPGPRR